MSLAARISSINSSRGNRLGGDSSYPRRRSFRSSISSSISSRCPISSGCCRLRWAGPPTSRLETALVPPPALCWRHHLHPRHQVPATRRQFLQYGRPDRPQPDGRLHPGQQASVPIRIVISCRLSTKPVKDINLDRPERHRGEFLKTSAYRKMMASVLHRKISMLSSLESRLFEEYSSQWN
jgi:hypothetical protein